jgi:hypothetical protein
MTVSVRNGARPIADSQNNRPFKAFPDPKISANTDASRAHYDCAGSEMLTTGSFTAYEAGA